MRLSWITLGQLMETSYCAFLQNVVKTKEDQSPEPQGFLWPCLRRSKSYGFLSSALCMRGLLSNFPGMLSELITDWPKLLIFWSSVFSFQKSLLVCRFRIPVHFKAKSQPGDPDLNPLCYQGAEVSWAGMQGGESQIFQALNTSWMEGA